MFDDNDVKSKNKMLSCANNENNNNFMVTF